MKSMPVRAIDRPDRNDLWGGRCGSRFDRAPRLNQRLMRLIFVPSMLRLAIRPCWSEMNA